MIRLTFHYICRKKKTEVPEAELHHCQNMPPSKGTSPISTLYVLLPQTKRRAATRPSSHHWRPLPPSQQSVRTPHAGHQPPTTVLTPACVIVISSGQGCLGIEDGEGVWGGSAPVESQMKVAMENRRRMRMRLRWATKASLSVCLFV